MSSEIGNIMKNALVIKFERHSPTNKELLIMQRTILEFIKSKKRKLYGGAAIHFLLKKKGNKGIYVEDPDITDDVFDFDFYSTTPKEDMHEICDRIYKLGFKYISGAEAAHEDTFGINYHNIRLGDITFVPPNVYAIIPTVEYEKIHVCAPEFIMVDFYRMRSNPTNSFFRLDKFWIRQQQLLEFYPEFNVTNNTSKNNTSKNNTSKNNTSKNNLTEELLSILEDPNIFPIGTYALNIYIKIANSITRKEEVSSKNTTSTKKEEVRKNTTTVKEFPESTLEVISLDVLDTVNKVNKELKKLKNLETEWVEYSPLFQLYGGSAVLKDKQGRAILRIYDYNKRCVPYFKYTSVKKLQIPSFDYLICYWYYEWVRLLTIKKDTEQAKSAICTLHSIRKEYLKAQKLDNFSKDHPFQILRIDCKGTDADFLVETSMRRNQRKIDNKLIVYRYQPQFGIKEAPPFIFTNASGREVRNERYKKFTHDEANNDSNNTPT